jgi:DNA-binding NtrC family response regulator
MATISGQARSMTVALRGSALLDDAFGETIILPVFDIYISGMDGLDLLSILGARRQDLPAPTILASGNPEAVIAALAHGAEAFRIKPVDFPNPRQAIITEIAGAMGATDDRATDRRDH